MQLNRFEEPWHELGRTCILRRMDRSALAGELRWISQLEPMPSFKQQVPGVKLYSSNGVACRRHRQSAASGRIGAGLVSDSPQVVKMEMRGLGGLAKVWLQPISEE